MTTTAIEWTDEVWNPVTGCSHVSEGCRNCYAEREWTRLSANPKTVYHGRKFTDVQCHEDRLIQPLTWKKPRMVFVNSMSDLFHPDVPFDFIDKVFAVMALASQHKFQVLTKRPERMTEYLNWEARVHSEHSGDLDRRKEIDRIMDMPDWVTFPAGKAFPRWIEQWPLPNVWLGVSVEDQKTADARIPKLLECPAAIRFVSYEPALGPVDFEQWLGCASCGNPGPLLSCSDPAGLPLCDDCAEWAEGPVTTSNKRLGWIIAGGESGPNARPSHPDYFRQVRDQCAAAGVPFFFKQWGEYRLHANLGAWYLLDADLEKRIDTGEVMELGKREFLRVGKKRAGRLLDGVEHNAMPGRG